jgi:hypothetical protein
MRGISEGAGWRVMRQDTNGNQFEVARYPDEAEALEHVERFESAEYPHHQMYWAERCPSSAILEA